MITANSYKNGLFKTGNMECSTDQGVFDELNREFNFNLDPCATKENAKCKKFYTKEDNGLEKNWEGRVFMNPPYGREIGDWMKKAYESVNGGGAELVVCLIPSRTDTKWWHDYVMQADEIRFVRGRLKFNGMGPAPFPSAIAIFRGKVL
jgi:phage N-6-adenine-methyltransferase